MKANDHSIGNEKILSREENEISLEYRIPSDSDLFDGHFDAFKLMPAVGQFETVTRFAKKYFGLSRGVSSIKRMKFSCPILPGASVVLNMKFNAAKNSVSFKILDAAQKNKLYSSGSFSAEKENE